jgi:hypothetical protein
MKDVKVKLEQVVQSLEQYQEVLSKDGDLSIAENKKLAAIIKRVTDKAMLADGFFNNEEVTELIESYNTILTKYSALSITKMKSLETSALANLDKLRKLLVKIDAWIVKANALDEKYKKGVANHLEELEELKVEGTLVVKVVDGNQLNPASQEEFAKIIGTSDGSKKGVDESIEKLLLVREEDRTEFEKAQLLDLETRKETIESFEKDLLNLIDNNGVRIDRVAQILDHNGKLIPDANGQALYDPVTNELVLELDSTGGSALGAHELLHLVQAKKGKLVFLSGGRPAGIFNDLLDEVEAYKIQYSIDPTKVPGSPAKITDITPAFVKNIEGGRLYGSLPADQHDLNTTITKLNNHPTHLGVVKKEILNGKVIHPGTGLEISDWDYYKDWSFIDFAEDILFDTTGVKTNAEFVGFVIIK